MDVLTIILMVIVVVVAVLLSSMIVSSMLSKQMRTIQAMIATSTLETPTKEVTQVKTSEGRKAEESFEKERKKVFQGVNEEEILKKLKQVINEKVQNVLNEAKKKKERLLMLLDVARGYALGFISEEE